LVSELLILLDTHALVWMIDDDRRLGVHARRAIDDAVSELGLLVSPISGWEVALLVKRGRLAIGRDAAVWMDMALRAPGVRPAVLDMQIAVGSVDLPGEFHADPADRILIATARRLDIPLLTADRAILAYAAAGHLKVVDANT
jgi:PIN domain nuclease of toxin-antitoxin system